jgi:hypothetical protein
MAEGAKISSMSFRWLAASFDTQQVVDSDALVFWQRITGATLSARSGSACGFLTLMSWNGDPRRRVQALLGSRPECCPGVEIVMQTQREKHPLKEGRLHYPHHLPGYESLRGSPCGAVFRVSLGIGEDL